MGRKNRNIQQSYISIMSMYGFTISEKRVVYRIVEWLQPYLRGYKKPDGHFLYKGANIAGVELTMPIASFLADPKQDKEGKVVKDENYKQVQMALISLHRNIVKYDDSKEWGEFTWIAAPKITKNKRTVTITLLEKVYQVLSDLSKGYRRYQIGTVFQLKTTYSMRLYEIFSQQKKQFTESIEHFKDRMSLSDKYQNTKALINRVIVPSQKELDNKAPYSFVFDVLFEKNRGKRGRKKIIAIKFTPVEHPENRDKYLEEKSYKLAIRQHIPIKTYISSELECVLKNQVGFSDTEIRNNYDLFHQFKLLDLSIDRKVVTMAKKAKNPQGYIINTLKRKIDAQSQIPIEYNGATKSSTTSTTSISKSLNSSGEDIDIQKFRVDLDAMLKGENVSSQSSKDDFVNTTLIEELKTKKPCVKKKVINIEDAIEVHNDLTRINSEVSSLQESKTAYDNSSKLPQDMVISPIEQTDLKETIPTSRPTIQQQPTSDVKSNNIEFKAVFQNYLHAKEIDGKYADLIQLANTLDIKFYAATIGSLHKKKHFINFVKEKTCYKSYKELIKAGLKGDLLYSTLSKMNQGKSIKNEENIHNNSINLPPIQNIVNPLPFKSLPVHRSKFFKRIFIKLFKRKKRTKK